MKIWVEGPERAGSQVGKGQAKAELIAQGNPGTQCGLNRIREEKVGKRWDQRAGLGLGHQGGFGQKSGFYLKSKRYRRLYIFLRLH